MFCDTFQSHLLYFFQSSGYPLLISSKAQNFSSIILCKVNDILQWPIPKAQIIFHDSKSIKVFFIIQSKWFPEMAFFNLPDLNPKDPLNDPFHNYGSVMIYFNTGMPFQIWFILHDPKANKLSFIIPPKA